MQNEKAISRIREGGILQGPDQVESRLKQLQETCGFRFAPKAEYALIASCFNSYLEPADMTALRKLLDHYNVDYSLLPKEYCCGDPFYLHAIDEQHEGDLEQADTLGREFLDQNIKQTGELGADKLLVYCAGCDLVLNRIKTDSSLEIIWHPTLLSQLFKGGKLEIEADYYAGCHRYRRALMGDTPDLDSVVAALNRIDGLHLNHLDSSLCCMNPDQLETLAASVKSHIVITPCSGCSMFLRKALADKGDYRIFLLSEVLWAAIDQHQL